MSKEKPKLSIIDPDGKETDITDAMEAISGQQPFPLPADEAFEDALDDFLDAPEIQTLAEALIDEYPEDFGHTSMFDITYRYKRKGGESGGLLTLGKCVKLAGPARHYSKATNDGRAVDFLIWIAADHCRERITFRQMQALVFHELCHIGQNENGKATVKGHEFEGFEREIAVFGAWQTPMIRIQEAFNEHPLAQRSLLEQTQD